MCLGSCLWYCFFENSLSFFPFLFYLLKNPLECFFLFLNKSFASFKEFLSFTGNETEEKDVGANQSVRMEKSGNQAETDNPLPTGKSHFDEEKLSVSKNSTILENQLSVTPGAPSWFSPLEKEVIEKDRRLGSFGIGLGVLLALCQTCVGVLRTLGYTQEFVKTMIGKGYPKWLFSWLSHPNPKPFPERSLFDLLVVILVLNLVILYALLRML